MSRITGFLEGWQALTKASAPQPLEPTRRLLDGVRLLRVSNVVAGPPAAAPEHPPVERIARLFTGLRQPLARERSQGSFIDVWSVAGIRRKELPNAAVLAWMIDPRGSHGQGTLCLSALFDLVGRTASLDLSGIRLEAARIQSEERPLGSDRDRVDIVVEMPDLLVFIEVKIDAPEGQAQLSRYVDSAARVAAARPLLADGSAKPTLTVFLSPRAPVETVHGVVHVTWLSLSTALISAARRAPAMAGVLIRSFAVHTRSFG